MIEVTVKTLDGKNRAFSVPDEITVKQFKKTIAASIEIKADIQRLIFKGRILSDEHKINDYDVNGKTIHVVQKFPPSSLSASTATTTTASASNDPLPSRSRDLDGQGRSSRRIFLSSYSLASDGMRNEVLPSTIGSTATTTASVAGGSGGRNQGENDIQNRINHIKKMIAGAKRTIGLLEGSSGAENDTNAEDGEHNDQSADHGTAEPADAGENSTAQDSDSSVSVSALTADLVEEAMNLHDRVQPHVSRYQQRLVDDTVYRKKSPDLEEAQKQCDLVSQTLHYMGHVYHGLSDLTVDMSSVPRQITAPARRPTTAIFQQSIPVLQAEISLSGGPLMSSQVTTATSTVMTPSTVPDASESSSTASAQPRPFPVLSGHHVVTSVSPSQLLSSVASDSTSFSSLFPLVFSSSVGSSATNPLLPWTTSLSSSSSTAVPSTSTTTSAAAPASSSATVTSSAAAPAANTTTEPSTRSATRRGYRRFSEAFRSRPTVSISTHDFGEQSRHSDPYLICHSRHFRPTPSSTTQQGGTAARNANQSLSDIISSLVSSIMTTPGESVTDVTAPGRHGNDDDGPVSASFNTRFDSPMRALHEQLFDDAEVEEEVISTWHPLDSSSSLVHNLFGSADRPNDSGRPDNPPRSSNAAAALQDFLNIMGNGQRSEENLLELLIRCVLDSLSFSDILSVLNGNSSPLSRLRQPLLELVRNTVLNGEDPLEENLSTGVVNLVGDLFWYLDEVASDAEPQQDVDFVASLISFLRHHLKKIFSLVLKSPDECDETSFCENLASLCCQMAHEFVCLCDACLSNNGFASFTQNLLFSPFGLHTAIGPWTRNQLLSFQRSVLPSSLQTDIRKHVVLFSSPSSSENSYVFPRSAENDAKGRSSKETNKTSGEQTKASELGADAAENSDSAARSVGFSDSSAHGKSSGKTKDHSRCFKKTLNRNRGDAKSEGEPATKRRRVTSCNEGNSHEADANIQIDVEEPTSSENGTVSRDIFRKDASLTSSADRLSNGVNDLDGALPQRDSLPDSENLSDSEKK